MAIQVIAQGFELTDALKTSCLEETKDKLLGLALHNFSSRWALSVDAGNHVAHITWSDGPFHGDVTVKSDDMYGSIHQATKKAIEQMKKAHDKRYDHHNQKGIPTGDMSEDN